MSQTHWTNYPLLKNKGSKMALKNPFICKEHLNDVNILQTCSGIVQGLRVEWTSLTLMDKASKGRRKKLHFLNISNNFKGHATNYRNLWLWCFSLKLSDYVELYIGAQSGLFVKFSILRKKWKLLCGLCKNYGTIYILCFSLITNVLCTKVCSKMPY